MAGTWAPYTGADSILLAALLLAIAAAFAYVGARLRSSIAPARPGKVVTVFLVLIWVVSLLAFFVDSISYGFVLLHANLVAVYQSYTAPNPISRVTEASAVAAFVIILIMMRL